MTIRAVIFITVLGFLCPAMLNAQDRKSNIPFTQQRLNDTLVALQNDTIRQKDLYDVISSVFNKHKAVENKATVIGTKPVYSVLPAIGYTLQTKLAVTLSGNVAFRTGPDSRISTISSNAAYTQRKQIIIPIQSNIWTTDNNYNFIGDIKFYKYPQSTFGLGSNSSAKNNNAMDYTLFRFYETILKHITGNLYAGAGFIVDKHLGVEEEGNPDGSLSDYARYGPQQSTTSTGITLNALIDMRDNSINPTRGFYTALLYRDNKEFLGSTSSWRSLVVDVRKYCRFPAGSKNVLAFWSYDWLVLNGEPPYLDLPANTWDQYNGTGRGYIQGRFRGAQMVYAESEYRYAISRNGLLGGVAFINAESFSSAPGTPLQRVQPGYGAGLRIKLNKVSKTNIAIDYGFGNQGSKGVFVTVGEIF
ncbi:BamA/TamA family outer membrane protein [Mucilaginibacter glaciei]|uniref:BamA/TamA family outer membrane protein n=1 Tax=Mucilaginibacter glaciei TaxID=2772109 RepID=A0A926NT88_9SPHI|nr:BamA/TamA family outer membrane protein [Mucilaginibacter glaciei]MBD1394592.1 BamA/TamA family outer membrane protein [Mucilaginibacter glaciei]